MTSRVPGPMGTGPRAPRRPGRWPRNWAALYDTGTPAARVLRADWDGVMPITGPSPASAQMRAASARTRVLPAPAEKATDCNIFVRCCRARYGLCR